MQHRILLTLTAIPTLAGSMLTLLLWGGMASVAQAVGVSEPANSASSCDAPTPAQLQSLSIHRTHHGVLLASAIDIPVEYPALDFSAAESDAAAVLFGCDCPSCINALRQLQSRPLLENGQGHCWSSLQQRVSPQQVQNVLQTLEAEDLTVD